MRELRAGVWHWHAPHPEWEPGHGWDEIVSSYAIDDGERLLVFDPLALPAELEELAGEREAAIVLTSPWHVRDAAVLAERLGAALYVPSPDEGVDGLHYLPGDRLPVGVETFPGMEPNEAAVWVEGCRAVVLGDAVIDRGGGLELPSDWFESKSVEQIRADLRPLLDLPVELVLPTHGEPTDKAALARALA